MLRGCGLFGRCRLFLRSKTASNSRAPDEPLPASTEVYEDAGLHRFLEGPAVGNAGRLTAAERLLLGADPMVTRAAQRERAIQAVIRTGRTPGRHVVGVLRSRARGGEGPGNAGGTPPGLEQRGHHE